MSVAPASAGQRPSQRTAWALGVVELTTWGSLIYTFSVFLPEMHRHLGFSITVITAAYSFSIAVRAFVVTAAGWWIDRYGAAGLMIAGSLGAAVTLAAWSFISSYAELFAIFLCLGLVTSAVLYEPAFAIVVRLYPERRNNSLLTVTVLGGLASPVFLPAGAALVGWLGWRHALIALAVIVLAGAVLPLALFVRDPRGPAPDGHDPGSAASPGIRPAARSAAESKPFRWLTLASFLAYAALVFVNVYLVSYLLGQGYTLTGAATATGALGILSVLGRVVLTRSAQRIRLGRLTGALVACQALAVIPLFAGSLVGLVAFVLMFGAGFGVLTLARASLLADYAPPRMYARWAGFQAAVVTAAQVIAPVGGSLLHNLAGYPAVFGTGAVLLAGAAGSLFMADRVARETAGPAPQVPAGSQSPAEAS